jgi:diguanylate cyclase (GGDEF)-like protein
LLEPYLDGVFQDFYDRLLSDERFQVFFADDQQVRQLVQRQRQNLLDSLEESEEQLLNRYLRLGHIHFQLDIPYINFVAGMHLLADLCARLAANQLDDAELTLKVQDYFNRCTEYMAKGYFRRMLDEDEKSLRKIKALVAQSCQETECRILNPYFNWFMELLHAVRTEDEASLPELNIQGYLLQQLGDKNLLDGFEEAMGSGYFAESLRSIRKRLEVDAQNIFYFIEHGQYLEALPLYAGLLDIYKFTLIYSNLVATQSSSKLAERLQKQSKAAETDALTGAYNRYKYDLSIQAAIEHFRLQGSPHTMMVIDVDHFKRINDEYGHHTGDQVLSELAEFFRHNIRSTDLLFRYGGEEFVVLCLQTQQKKMRLLGEKLHRLVKEQAFSGIEGITVSIGIAEIAKEDDAEAWLRRADEALYRAKKAGRDRIEMA